MKNTYRTCNIVQENFFSLYKIRRIGQNVQCFQLVYSKPVSNHRIMAIAMKTSSCCSISRRVNFKSYSLYYGYLSFLFWKKRYPGNCDRDAVKNLLISKFRTIFNGYRVFPKMQTASCTHIGSAHLFQPRIQCAVPIL